LYQAAALAELGARNGFDLDGTPIIKTLSELDDLTDDGFVTQTQRPLDGSQGPPLFSCPVYKDPRDGAIADDAFIEMVRDDDGNVLPAEQFILDEFPVPPAERRLLQLSPRPFAGLPLFPLPGRFFRAPPRRSTV
jgi:hypothetical protein